MFDNSSDCWINAGNYIISLSQFITLKILPIIQDTPVYIIFGDVAGLLKFSQVF